MLRGDSSAFVGADGNETMVVNGTAVVYSRSMKLQYGQAFGIKLKMGNGSGTANMKIQLEESDRPPASEGAADPHWVIGDLVADVYTNLNDGASPVWHIKNISPVAMDLIRLKITGLGTNPVDASLLATFFQQEIVT